jgi:hypothetical protein
MATSTSVTAPSVLDRAFRNRLGRGLVWFGVSGLVILVVSALAFGLALAPLASTARTLGDQGDELIALLGPATESLEAAATSADHGASSLISSETSARDAAAVTSQLADAMDGLGVFSPAFAETAARSRSLSENLKSTADSLHQNQIDSASVATSLRSLANQLKSLKTSVTATVRIAPSGPVTSVGLPLLVALAVALLLWLAALALGCIWLGRRILRGLAI